MDMLIYCAAVGRKTEQKRDVDKVERSHLANVDSEKRLSFSLRNHNFALASRKDANELEMIGC